MIDDDSDEMLGARLDSALRSDLALGDVDVTTLLEGSRHRARKVRTRRIASVGAAALLVLAVPVGYEVLNPAPGVGPQPAAMLPSSSRSAATGPAAPIKRPKPNPTVAPSVVQPPSASTGYVSATDDLTTAATPSISVPTSIPDSFASFTAAQLPAGVSLQQAIPNTAEVLIAGQECGPLSVGQPQLRPVTGRQWLWAAGTGQPADRSISVTITGWAEGESPIAFRQAIAGTGHCRWLVPQKRRALTVELGQESWASTSNSGDLHYASTLVRIGNGIVGVQVQDPAGAGPAAVLADRLTRIQLTRMKQG